MTALAIRGLSKSYGSTVAVDSIDLDIRSGDLFFLLGPSGCGKTTLLRMIAGFIEPTAGQILFDGRDVARVPPEKRNAGMVFQSYALWPHMSVAENVAFGLKVRKLSREEIAARVKQALAMVRMETYADRKPNQLSGGQQQRVALARALAIQPHVLLLDEPLSNLDAKLRLEMRQEIRRLCSELKITTVYVTHDQKEALSMADQVAVLNHGKIVQQGPPRELYERPRSAFVADFLGETNFVEATVTEVGGDRVLVETAAGRLTAARAPGDGALSPGRKVTLSIRPEAIRVGSTGTAGALGGTLVRSTYLGEVAQHVVELPSGASMRVLELHPAPFENSGRLVTLGINAKDVVVLEV